MDSWKIGTRLSGMLITYGEKGDLRRTDRELEFHIRNVRTLKIVNL